MSDSRNKKRYRCPTSMSDIDVGHRYEVIGFDLDQTLYPKSPEIDQAIQTYLYERIAEFKKVSLNEAEKLFRDLYKEGRGLSGSKTLEALGLPDAKEQVQLALERAPIDKFLKPDQETIGLMKKLKEKYFNLDLITGSDRDNTLRKLNKLEIEPSLFSHIITKDDASKRDLAAYKMWLEFYPDFKPEQFLYVGDRVSSDHEVPRQIGIRTLLVNQKEIDPNVDCLQLKALNDLGAILL